MQFRNDIQGLRALAFLIVFIFHLNAAWLPGGFLGVDLFFVISGYLITSITLSDIDKDKFSFLNFYKKRFKRLVPAYYVLLLFCALGGYYFYLYTDLYKFIKSLKYSTLFISNYVFSSGDSYFGAKLSENPFLHTWSLSIEMQFYLLLPFIILYFKKNLKYILILLVIVLSVYSTYIIEFRDGKGLMYFSLLARIPEFLVGALLSILFKKGLDFGKTKNNILAIVGILIFGLCSFLITEDSNFPGILALVPCISIGTILVLKTSVINDVLSNKIFVKIGEYSYSLYLWHWPVMAFIRYKNDSYEFSTIDLFIVIFLTTILSWLSYNLVENGSRKFTDKRFITIYGIVTILLLSVAFNFKEISKDKIIPDLYSKPYFGIESHGTSFAQKLGDLTKNDSILLIGNSHANMLKPFLDCIGKGNNFSVSTYTNSGYMAIDGIEDEDIESSDQLRRLNISRTKIYFVRELIQNNRIIIINNSVSFNKLPSTRKALEGLIASLRRDQKIILLNTFPSINKNLFKINSGFKKFNNTNIVKIDDKVSREFLFDLEKKYSNVYVYDISQSNIFKTPGYINDTVAYYDPNHINTFASLKLAEDLEEDFMKFFNDVRSK